MRYVFLLAFMPVLAFSQVTPQEIMAMSNLDMFKKVVIENRYELCDCSSQSELVYGYDIREEGNNNRSYKWATYTEGDGFHFEFNLSWYDKEYQDIIDYLKANCNFVRILNTDGSDYVLYSCPNSRYKGKIGFMIEDYFGHIRHFPLE